MKINLTFIGFMIALVFPCNDFNEIACIYTNGCEWVDEIEWSNCSNYNTASDCSWANENGGNCNWSWDSSQWEDTCSGGSFQLDTSYCQESECVLTTDDILGPYYFQNAPFRSIVAHENEPGQRLFISGKIKQNNCEDFISGALIEIWQANDAGCYGIVEECETGNPENDYFNLRGKFFSNSDGDYSFESILPGYYGSRPRHIHIKITTPDGIELVSQLYFGNDPYCENDQWCQDADDRIIVLTENNFILNGEIDLTMDSSGGGILLGDINLDNILNVQDIILLVGIILNNSTSNDFQRYSSDVNVDNNIDVLDIVQLVTTIIN